VGEEGVVSSSSNGKASRGRAKGQESRGRKEIEKLWALGSRTGKFDWAKPNDQWERGYHAEQNWADLGIGRHRQAQKLGAQNGGQTAGQLAGQMALADGTKWESMDVAAIGFRR
jgi:hypothetical protein